MADKHTSLRAPESAERRNFLIKAAAAVAGAVVAIFPFAVGLFTFADPLRRRSSGEGDGFFRVAALDAVPDDGLPRQFAVIADRTDSWNRFPNEAIGAIYLRRSKGEKTPVAFNAICPHAGCFVAHAAERNLFQCPCHNSAFQLDGSIIQPSPSPRAMDELACEVRSVDGRQEVWVKFQDYLPGRAEAIPKV
jgi:nitrite reductase/ring-hydroxylating ferredoxin subunit